MSTVVVMETPDEEPVGPPPTCRHLACGQPSTSTTVLVRGGRSWELHHCEEHETDGAEIAMQLGFLVVAPVQPWTPLRSHLSVVPCDPAR